MENIAELWNDITIDSAEFLLEQTEKRLQASIDVGKQLTERAVNVMQFSIPMSIGLAGLIISEPRFELLIFYVVILIISLSISCVSLHVYDLYNLEYSGAEPLDFIRDEYFLFEGEDQRLALMLSVVVTNQIRSHKNETINRKRQRMFFYTMGLVKLLFVLGVFLFAMGLLNLISLGEMAS
ncbi:MAG: hypothetical protein WDO14_04815 [Bacteroidota bacterium]